MIIITAVLLTAVMVVLLDPVFLPCSPLFFSVVCWWLVLPLPSAPVRSPTILTCSGLYGCYSPRRRRWLWAGFGLGTSDNSRQVIILHTAAATADTAENVPMRQLKQETQKSLLSELSILAK